MVYDRHAYTSAWLARQLVAVAQLAILIEIWFKIIAFVLMEVLTQVFQHVKNAAINALHVAQHQATALLATKYLRENYQDQIVFVFKVTMMLAHWFVLNAIIHVLHVLSTNQIALHVIVAWIEFKLEIYVIVAQDILMMEQFVNV